MMEIPNTELTDPALLEAIRQQAKTYEIAPGEVLIRPGQHIKTVPIVVEGSLKVMRTDRQGHELFLYYIEPGETCAVSLSCCSASSPSEVKAVAEENTRLIAIPLPEHESWLNEFPQWKKFVARTYQKRFQELLRVLDEVAFRKMDERLLRYLITKSRQLATLELQITHQEIARELGTSREVVSRLLKQLEKRKLVELGRNKIITRANLHEYIQE